MPHDSQPESAAETAGETWRCLVTDNPVGTDTIMIGWKCDCQVCRASETIDRLRSERAELVAALEAITKECATNPANPFLADNMDRIAIAALTKLRGG